MKIVRINVEEEKWSMHEAGEGTKRVRDQGGEGEGKVGGDGRRLAGWLTDPL